ncbi:MAG: DNA repair protein RadA [Firmicutes bacterium]|nr:DNA repair protein RadA [Bacillota bacterium]
MARIRRSFFCQKCGQESPKWQGRCPNCGEWNTIVEEMTTVSEGRRELTAQSASQPNLLASVVTDTSPRFSTQSPEFDRVLGGGVVPGSLVLIGGDPGIGKSTLLLQTVVRMSQQYGRMLYVSGEESVQQIKMRFDRLELEPGEVYLLNETNLADVETWIARLKPCLVIIDSIQTIYRPEITVAPGSVSQVRECTGHLMRLSKTQNLPIFVVGHVTKEGAVAGPRLLEHIVDTVLYLEGERHHTFRILRSVKNRFGSTNEIGIFEMSECGLTEVQSPSEWFLAQRPSGAAGSVVVPTLEGSRPVLVEIQALVTASSFGQARRMTTGVDYNRVAMIMAVLEKRVGLHLIQQDAYVNVVGGVRLDEPAVDLGIALAIASSHRGIPTRAECVVMGEIGLTGEIRAVNQLEKRIKEAVKLGFCQCVIPRSNLRYLKSPVNAELVAVNTLQEALEVTLGGK